MARKAHRMMGLRLDGHEEVRDRDAPRLGEPVAKDAAGARAFGQHLDFSREAGCVVRRQELAHRPRQISNGGGGAFRLEPFADERCLHVRVGHPGVVCPSLQHGEDDFLRAVHGSAAKRLLQARCMSKDRIDWRAIASWRGLMANAEGVNGLPGNGGFLRACALNQESDGRKVCSGTQHGIYPKRARTSSTHA